MLRKYCIAACTALVILPGVFLAAVSFEGFGLGPETYHSMQTRWFLALNAGLAYRPTFWENITELGNAGISIPLLSILILRNPQAWAAIFGAIPLSALLSVAGKNIAAVPRPAAMLDHNQFNIVGQMLAAHNSLPSGHTITAFAIITVVVGSLMLSSRRTTASWLLMFSGIVLACLIGLSRVAVGAHWPLDVAVGACFGVAGGISGIVLAQLSSRWWQWVTAPRGRAIFGVIMAIWGLVLIKESLPTVGSTLILPWIAASCAISSSLFLLYTPNLPQPPERKWGWNAESLMPAVGSDKKH